MDASGWSGFHFIHFIGDWSLPIMEKEIRKFLTSISVLGLLASCTGAGTLETRNDNASMATKSIRTFADHDELARRY
jgi:hypothetical protein